MLAVAVVDHFSMFTMARAMPIKEAATCADALNGILNHFVVPEIIHDDMTTIRALRYMARH